MSGYAPPPPGPGDIFPSSAGPTSGYAPVQRYTSPAPYQPQTWGQPPVITSAPSAGPPTSAYLPDPRMTSPPPMLHHSSSQMSGISQDSQMQGWNGFARPFSPHPSNDGRITPGADMGDEPLLRQQTGDSRYGAPFQGGPASENGRAYQNPNEPITMRYGPAPDRVLRRLKTTKRVQ